MINRLGSAILNWYRLNTMTPTERFLSESSDLVDLERRQNAINRGDYSMYHNNTLHTNFFGQRY